MPPFLVGRRHQLLHQAIERFRLARIAQRGHGCVHGCAASAVFSTMRFRSRCERSIPFSKECRPIKKAGTSRLNQEIDPNRSGTNPGQRDRGSSMSERREETPPGLDTPTLPTSELRATVRSADFRVALDVTLSGAHPLARGLDTPPSHVPSSTSVDTSLHRFPSHRRFERGISALNPRSNRTASLSFRVSVLRSNRSETKGNPSGSIRGFPPIEPRNERFGFPCSKPRAIWREGKRSKHRGRTTAMAKERVWRTANDAGRAPG